MFGIFFRIHFINEFNGVAEFHFFSRINRSVRHGKIVAGDKIGINFRNVVSNGFGRLGSCLCRFYKVFVDVAVSETKFHVGKGVIREIFRNGFGFVVFGVRESERNRGIVCFVGFNAHFVIAGKNRSRKRSKLRSSFDTVVLNICRKHSYGVGAAVEKYTVRTDAESGTGIMSVFVFVRTHFIFELDGISVIYGIAAVNGFQNHGKFAARSHVGVNFGNIIGFCSFGLSGFGKRRARKPKRKREGKRENDS